MRHRGPVLKERKKIVKNVGRAKQKSSWRAEKYEWVQSWGAGKKVMGRESDIKR